MPKTKMSSGTSQTIKCCSSLCSSRETVLDARIEVKTLLPNQGFGKLKPKLLVLWKQNGEAEFHVQCWDELFGLSRQRAKKDQKVSMCKEEKALIKAAAEAPEQYDGIEDILNKAQQAANWIKNSKHCVTFTGAGISTSAGIGDYRGKAGKWTEEDQTTIDMDTVFAGSSQGNTSLKEKQEEDLANSDAELEDDGVPYEKLRPTYTHEALFKLMESGYLKHVISQNGDGLHGLSGIGPDHLSELHGNVFKEYCEKCDQRYDRKFYVMDDIGSQFFEEVEDNGSSAVKKPRHAKKCDLCGLSHRTGRKCNKKGCKGFLRDTIINFRDLLDEYLLDEAAQESEQSDVMLCLGTTLQVTPACDLVKGTKKGSKLIICNRQETPMDKQIDKWTRSGATRGCRVFGDCDLFMGEIMSQIYPEKELKEWESKRADRLKHYDTLRD